MSDHAQQLLIARERNLTKARSPNMAIIGIILTASEEMIPKPQNSPLRGMSATGCLSFARKGSKPAVPFHEFCRSHDIWFLYINIREVLVPSDEDIYILNDGRVENRVVLYIADLK